ncbi:MAG: hypothetical protein ACI90V_011723, partial [Bacillariaceae sp.]
MLEMAQENTHQSSNIQNKKEIKIFPLLVSSLS